MVQPVQIDLYFYCRDTIPTSVCHAKNT